MRRLVAAKLKTLTEIRFVHEVANGLEAVEQARELQPDLILMDVGLPLLNGIEATREIRRICPTSKILFASANRSPDIVAESLRSGGLGYVLKSDAQTDLLPAICATLRGERFLSSSLLKSDGPNSPAPFEERAQDNLSGGGSTVDPRTVLKHEHHGVAFYSDERQFSDGVGEFLRLALTSGRAAIVIATEAHRQALLRRLLEYGVDVSSAIESGKYIALDAATTLATFMVNGMPDPSRFVTRFGDLAMNIAKPENIRHRGISLFGEGVQLLWEQGNLDAVLQVEHLCQRVTSRYDIEILCGYCVWRVPGGMELDTFERICREHSSAYSG